MTRTQPRQTTRSIRFAAPAALLAALLAGAWSPVAAADNQGFLYGTVETESGSSFKGRLRWANEEAFWGDFFNSLKTDRQYLDQMPDSQRRRERIKIFGMTIGVKWKEYDSSRMFKARFGDISEIRVGSGEKAVVLMKSGTEYRVEGGSNDIGAKIHVWDNGLGEVEIEWSKIDRIVFQATPKNMKVEDFRLHGMMQTRSGDFNGYVQWDQDEGLSSDKLDGNTREVDLSLEMGRIKSIGRRSRSSSRVVLRDGREFVLEGSNDVDSSNRGNFIEDERYGRVLVGWDAFVSLEFSDRTDSGPSYDDYEPGKRLRGKVTDVDGNSYKGQIVFDLDETETWELFDGNWDDLEYSIPMGRIAAVIPETRDSCRVVLHGGEELELEDSADTGEGNAGVMIVVGGDDEHAYVPWDEIERVDFDR